MKTNWILNLALAIAVVLGCQKSDDEEETPAATTNSVTSEGGTVTATGTLAIAFPSDLNLASAFVGDDAASLRIAGDIEEVDEYESAETKAEKLNDIFSATTVADCFALSLRQFAQPSCFAPNLQKSAWQSETSRYVVTLDSGVQQLLYGDGGIVEETETENGDGEACTAATINYFLEGAIAAIDQGKEIFASLVCASQFTGTSLPAVGETEDYLSSLADVTLPSGVSFTQAEMSLEEVSGVETYTTTLGIQIDDTESLWAYFRHQPSENRGHAVAFHFGVQDALQSANQLVDPAPGDPAPGDPAPGGGGNASSTTNAVAVQYQFEDGDLLAVLDKGVFKDVENDHPGDYIDSNGLIELAEIGTKNSGNNLADNFVRAFFNQTEGGGGNGIVGWTASLSDGFWRSFAYDVTAASDGSETAVATFGFSRNWVAEDEVVHDPEAGVAMACSWAQSMGGNPSADTGDHLEPAGPSGNFYNGVQVQTSTRDDATAQFEPVTASSYLGYTVGDDDCGSDNTLADVDEDGNVDGVFTAPSPTLPAVVGGVSITSSDVDVD